MAHRFGLCQVLPDQNGVPAAAKQPCPIYENRFVNQWFLKSAFSPAEASHVCGLAQDHIDRHRPDCRHTRQNGPRLAFGCRCRFSERLQLLVDRFELLLEKLQLVLQRPALESVSLYKRAGRNRRHQL
jgi:hypothetical protein